MINRQNFRFLLSGAAVLSMALMSTATLSAEIAKREVYRDATTITVDVKSNEEFAKLYNSNQAKSTADPATAAEVERAMGSREFQRRLMQSNELQRRVFASNEMQRRAYASSER